MKQNLRIKISKISNYLEVYVAVIILAGIIIMSLKLTKDLFYMLVSFSGLPSTQQFTEFLGDALKLVIGIEFVKMLAKHTPESVIEVLMFAIARKMIVESSNSLDIIAGVLSITILFFIRKYMHSNVKTNDKEIDCSDSSI